MVRTNQKQARKPIVPNGKESMQSRTRATVELTGEKEQDEGEHQRVTKIEERRRAIGDF
jgi:hypothetical protein